MSYFFLPRAFAVGRFAAVFRTAFAATFRAGFFTTRFAALGVAFDDFAAAFFFSTSPGVSFVADFHSRSRS
jgi:hypothetical protein